MNIVDKQPTMDGYRIGVWVDLIETEGESGVVYVSVDRDYTEQDIIDKITAKGLDSNTPQFRILSIET